MLRKMCASASFEKSIVPYLLPSPDNEPISELSNRRMLGVSRIATIAPSQPNADNVGRFGWFPTSEPSAMP